MLSLWNLYPLLLDFVVKVKVKAARLNATVIVVVEEKQQLGQDPTFSIDNSCNTLPSIPRGRDTWWDEKAPSSLEVHQIGWPTWKGRVEREVLRKVKVKKSVRHGDPQTESQHYQHTQVFRSNFPQLKILLYQSEDDIWVNVFSQHSFVGILLQEALSKLHLQVF